MFPKNRIEKSFGYVTKNRRENFWPKMGKNGYVFILKFACQTCWYDYTTMRFVSILIFCVSLRLSWCVYTTVSASIAEEC